MNSEVKSGSAAAANMARHIEAIRRVTVDHDYAYDIDGLLDDRVHFMSEHCVRVLDVAQCLRQRTNLFASSQLETVNISAEDPPADFIDDICAPSLLEYGRYDGIVCLSVLEHVYDPFSAIEAIHKLLKADGYLLLHVPFLFRYHAPPGLEFADCYRFSRDGLAWMLRDFSEVRLYSVRGPYSAALNLNRFWKKRIERLFGMRLDYWLDRIGMRLFGRPGSELQVSGYYAWARK